MLSDRDKYFKKCSRLKKKECTLACFQGPHINDKRIAEIKQGYLHPRVGRLPMLCFVAETGPGPLICDLQVQFSIKQSSGVCQKNAIFMSCVAFFSGAQMCFLEPSQGKCVNEKGGLVFS